MFNFVLNIFGLLVGLSILSIAALVLHQQWHFAKTRGDNYFGLTLKERRELKENISLQSKFLYPLVQVLAKIINLKQLPAFTYVTPAGKKFKGPKALANIESFRRCVNYPADEHDIFIATQMKCGTTWMQQIVFQILHHGQGELNDGEYKHMYAISPWIEMDPNGSVPLTKAPYVSQYKKKIIKTHMPVQLCPVNDKAKYIYVARHPASCFASTVDFLQMLTGPLCPKRDDLLNFFNSEKMWWGPWINHVQDWWQAANERDNILFVVFEDLKSNTKEVVAQIAQFLDVELSEQDLKKVLERIDFSYMKANDEYFEMAPPNIFSQAQGKGFFVKGSNQRHEDIKADEKQKIIDYCKSELKNPNAGWLEYYPDLKP